jgi:hypothetical protein
MGPPTIDEMGIAIMNSATARARSREGKDSSSGKSALTVLHGRHAGEVSAAGLLVIRV